ncbi:MAG: hypothetical protein ABI461_08760 [Polyangiaceae bacterium]
MGARKLLYLQPAMGRVARARALARPGHQPGVTALRMPDRAIAQLPTNAPRIFVHEGARQALERRLMAELTGPVSLSITDNRHSIVSHQWQHGMLRARVHHMFLDAPRSVQSALVRYVAHSDPVASLRIGRFIELNGGRLAPRSRRVPLQTAGRRHDLLAIFHDLNDRYFGGSMHALISWGKRTRSRQPRQTIKLGSYAAGDRLIRIHPALDRNWVPKYFVQFVVYHEMLHHIFPSRNDGSRRELHTNEFRDRECEFRLYDRAIRWERSHLARLLRS